jgi:hypothetical protein
VNPRVKAPQVLAEILDAALYIAEDESVVCPADGRAAFGF